MTWHDMTWHDVTWHDLTIFLLMESEVNMLSLSKFSRYSVMVINLKSSILYIDWAILLCFFTNLQVSRVVDDVLIFSLFKNWHFCKKCSQKSFLKVIWHTMPVSLATLSRAVLGGWNFLFVVRGVLVVHQKQMANHWRHSRFSHLIFIFIFMLIPLKV